VRAAASRKSAGDKSKRVIATVIAALPSNADGESHRAEPRRFTFESTILAVGITPLTAAGKVAVIPPRAGRGTGRDFDRDLYKARHLIENFFAKLKQFRAIATRYDKTARNFLAAVHLAAAAIWLN
jgi:transposase